MKYHKYLFFILLLIIFFALFYDFRIKRKTISILGSISKDISKDDEFKNELIYLSNNLNTNKYKYIIPNTNEGTIGFLLNNIPAKNKYNIITVYSETFPKNKMNNSYEIIMFNDAINFEEYIITHSDIFIILPGGIGTLYEISFILFILDTSNKNVKLLFYNKNNFFDFIKYNMKFFLDNGYLRDNIYNKFINNSLFFNNMNELISIL